MSGQARISLVVSDIQKAADAKLVSLVDRTGLEMAWSGNRDVHVDLHCLIDRAGEEGHVALGLERLAAAGTIRTADDRSENDHADLAILDGRWSLLLVYRTEDATERTRSDLAQSLDALRFTLAAVEAEREASNFPDASPKGGGGTSPPAELGVPIWWIRRVRGVLP